MNLPEYKRDSWGKQMLVLVIAIIVSMGWMIIPLANMMKIGPKEIVKTLDEVKKNYGNRKTQK